MEKLRYNKKCPVNHSLNYREPGTGYLNKDNEIVLLISRALIGSFLSSIKVHTDDFRTTFEQ